jgi:hypothetical protein
VATTTYVPTVLNGIAVVAIPLTTLTPGVKLPLILRSTKPVRGDEPVVCTVAVKVTCLPLITGFGVAVSVVVVVACAAAWCAVAANVPKTARREIMGSKGFIRLILES